MKSKIKFALAQIRPVAGKEKTALEDDIASGRPFPTLFANLEQVEGYVKRAKEEGADIVVFPEYFLQDILNEDRQVSNGSFHICQSVLPRLQNRYSRVIV